MIGPRSRRSKPKSRSRKSPAARVDRDTFDLDNFDPHGITYVAQQRGALCDFRDFLTTDGVAAPVEVLMADLRIVGLLLRAFGLQHFRSHGSL